MKRLRIETYGDIILNALFAVLMAGAIVIIALVVM